MTKASALPIKRLEQQLRSLQIDKLAKETGFRKRQPRKISPSDFLRAACLLSFYRDHSLQTFATVLGVLTEKTVSKQAVAQRLTDASVDFVQNALHYLIAAATNSRKVIQKGGFTSFERVLIVDSTTIRLNQKLISLFPGSRNQTKQSNAMLKIQTACDILTETFPRFELTPFTRNDQAASKDVLSFIQEGDLIIRDPGYFSLDAFKMIDRAEAFFLSRLHYGLSIFSEDGKPFDLPGNLRKYGSLDVDLILGAEGKMPVRLVALPISQSVADERRRKLRSNRDKRLNPGKTHLELLGWDIFITNVPRHIWDTEIVRETYRIRWRIETIFKAWKSHFNIANIRDGSAAQVQVLIYSRLICITLFQTFFFANLSTYAAEQTNSQISLIKLAKFISQHFWIITPLLINKQDYSIKLITYYCSYEKRKRLKFPDILISLT